LQQRECVQSHDFGVAGKVAAQIGSANSGIGEATAAEQIGKAMQSGCGYARYGVGHGPTLTDTVNFRYSDEGCCFSAPARWILMPSTGEADMKFWGACLIALSAFAGSAAANVPNHIDTEWSLSLDAQGRIVQLADLNKLDAPLRDPLEKAIRSWAFESGKIDGQPAATDTTLTVSLKFEPQGSDKYAIRIEDVRLGGRLAQIKFPTTRSIASEIRGSGASVVLKLRYNEAGKVVAVELQDITKSKPNWKKEILLAAKAWTFSPERVGGRTDLPPSLVPATTL
jgi:hypothetical protein